MSHTFLFHDYETFGADPRRDRPSQFAAIRTDADFNEIGEPVVLFCKVSDDYLPHPAACVLTRITPQKANRRGLPEIEFAEAVHAMMCEPNSCVLGYNSLRFDDEVTRHLFYRNLLDPYGREWQNGNSRWDLIDVVRAFYALRPEGIEWPMRELPDGRKAPSFKLEHLTAANGIPHEGAHDALSDVRATIALAKLLRAANPRLFDYLFSLRSKHKVNEMLDVVARRPVVHVSRRYPAAQGCSALVVPLARHPSNPNGIIVCDLSVDPTPLQTLTAEQIRERVFISNDDLPEGETRIPLKVIHANRCPVVLPIKALDVAAAERLGLDKTAAEQHWQQLVADPTLMGKVSAVFDKAHPDDESPDPDTMLYSGSFFSASDKREMAQVHQRESGWDLVGMAPAFQDLRLPEMLFRVRARSYPDTLETAERQQWEAFRWERFNDAQHSALTLTNFAREIERYNQQDLTPEVRQILEEVVMHVESIMPSQAFE
ncbi:exodeoxyribonuclease I [Zymobacter palmae]|uniref:Exodeoxyribonuclease I n=1 Tax=Zymobacter palmae TaxID=33074 RepID=A0A348HC77_9GAMM|nr:exodeoxyribonuclease I [Zymobacter palmae]BBG29229.1 exonuclease I [Zymobacter palmae]